MKLSATQDRARELIAALIEVFPARVGELEPFMDNDHGVLIEIEKRKPHQSDAQRAYYWRSLKAWGNDMGYTARETEIYVHPAVCAEAFGIKETRRFLNREVVIPKQTSSRLDKEAYSRLIETMIYLAAQHGYVVEPPAA